MDKLSEHDRVVLETIFEPLHPLVINSNFGRIVNEVANADDDSELSDEIKKLVKEAILLSESNNIEKALNLFEKSLQKAPRSASILNNRAQALRIVGKDHEALEDLTMAVNYSGGRGRAGVQALCQRAILYRRLGKNEEAKEDFSKAADYGSNFAKSQLIKMNPYAALCNAIVLKMTINSLQN